MSINCERSALVKRTISELGVLQRLKAYDAFAVSTIFVGFDVVDSDVDVLCCYGSKHAFADHVRMNFASAACFSLCVDADCVVARFKSESLRFEIYGCDSPIREQLAYRHYRVMRRLAHIGGNRFRRALRRLRTARGLKTEPAIARLLCLSGDPYIAVAQLADRSDRELSRQVDSAFSSAGRSLP